MRIQGWWEKLGMIRCRPSSIYSWSIEPLSLLHSKLEFEWVTLKSMICRSVTRLNLVPCIYLFWETDYIHHCQINWCHQVSEYVAHDEDNFTLNCTSFSLFTNYKQSFCDYWRFEFQIPHSNPSTTPIFVKFTYSEKATKYSFFFKFNFN